MKYHVTPKWNGEDIVTASEYFGGEEAAIEAFCAKWDADTSFAYDQITKIFLFDTLEEAFEFQAEYGGEILEIEDTYIELNVDQIEGYKYTRTRINKSDIIRIVE